METKHYETKSNNALQGESDTALICIIKDGSLRAAAAKYELSHRGRPYTDVSIEARPSMP